jgi:hypothetical protein
VPPVQEHRRTLASRCRLFEGCDFTEVKELFILFFSFVIDFFIFCV